MRARPRTQFQGAARQGGMVLVISMLLLTVVTLLAVAMFRGMGVGAKVAGTVREKQRALNTAQSAEQFAANWLASGSVTTDDGTSPGCGGADGIQNANVMSQVTVCSNVPYGPSAVARGVGPTDATTFVPTAVPWKMAGVPVGFQYTPPGMTTESCGDGFNATAPGPGGYACPPMFYISDLGAGSDSGGTSGEIYQVDAVGYGATPDSVAVIESTYLVSSASRSAMNL